MVKILLSALFVSALACATCFGQTSFQGLTPGKSTRAEVERVFGAPVKEATPTLIEYGPQPLTSKVYVQYRKDSPVIERIEFLCVLEMATCVDFFAQLHSSMTDNDWEGTIGDRPEKQVKYYRKPFYAVLTWANDQWVRLAFYSPELYKAAIASPQFRKRNSGERGSLDAQSKPGDQRSTLEGNGGTQPVMPPLPDYMRPPGSVTSTSVDRTGQTQTSGQNNSASTPASSNRPTTTTTRTYPSTGGGPPMTVTTRSSPPGGNGSSNSSRGATGTDDSDDTEREISMSADELRKFVGRYEFTQSTIPSLKAATVAMVGGKLKVTIGAATYPLVPLADDDSQVLSQSGSNQMQVSERVRFKLVGKAGAKIEFLMRAGKIDNLFYTEEQGDQMSFAVAIPRP